MGRKKYDIRDFSKGMASRADSVDINEDYSALSRDIDPETPLGMARGVETNATVASGLGSTFDRLKILRERDGSVHVVGIDFSQNDIAVIEDYRGVDTYNLLDGTVSHDNEATIDIMNNQAFIGLGNSSTSIPQQVGKIEKGQFGAGPPTDFQINDANLAPPQVIRCPMTAQNINPSGSPASSFFIDEGFVDIPSPGVLAVPYFHIATNRPATTYVRYSSVNRTTGEISNLAWGTDFNDECAADFIVTTAEDGTDTDVTSTNRSAYYCDVLNARFVNTGSDLDWASIHDEAQASTQDGNWVWLNSQGDAFEAGKSYVLAASFIYDGYKESPLTRIPAASYAAANGTGDLSYGGANIYWLLQNLQGMDDRLTGIKFYMAEGSETYAGPHSVGGQDTEFHFVKLIDIEDDNDFWRLDAITIVARGYYFQASGLVGNTFQRESGLNETQSSTYICYALSDQLNNHLFVGRCYNPAAQDENWDNYIVKSKPLDYAQFNWTEDYVVLPYPPTCIKAYGGRIYAFDEFNIYRINPEYMYIEDTFQGAGCLNQEAAVATDKGLFFISRDGMYVFDGTNATHISDVVDEVIDGEAADAQYGLKFWIENYSSGLSGDELAVRYHAEKNAIYIRAQGIEDTQWFFNLENQAWFSGQTNTHAGGLCHNEENGISTVGAGVLYDLFKGGSRELFKYISKRLSFGEPSQKKKFRDVIVNYEASIAPSISYRIDGSGSFTTIASLDSSSTTSNGYDIQIRIFSNSADTEIRDISVVYRDKGGFPNAIDPTP